MEELQIEIGKFSLPIFKEASTARAELKIKCIDLYCSSEMLDYISFSLSLFLVPDYNKSNLILFYADQHCVFMWRLNGNQGFYTQLVPCWLNHYFEKMFTANLSLVKYEYCSEKSYAGA